MEKPYSQEPKSIPILDEGIHVVLMRHGEPFKPGKEQVLDDESKSSIGLLTKNGEKTTQELFSRIIDQAQQQNPDKKIVLYFLGSPTQLQFNGEAYGARGIHTAEVAARGVNHAVNVEVRTIGTREVKPHDRLREANYYYAPGKPHPERYVDALASRAANEGVDKQDIWLRRPEDLEAIRNEDGLESPADSAERLTVLMEALNRHSRLVHRQDDEEIYYVAVTHGDTLKAFLNTYFKDTPEAGSIQQNPLVGSDGYNASLVLGNSTGSETNIEATFLPVVQSGG